MADQTRRTWDGSGFDDEADGFMKSDNESRQSRRLVPPTNPVPPPKPPERPGRRSSGVLIAVLAVAIAVLGGIIVWRTFVDMKPNDTEDSMVMSAPERSQTGTSSSLRVDTGVVVRQEQQAAQEQQSPTEPIASTAAAESQERRTAATLRASSTGRAASGTAAAADVPSLNESASPSQLKADRPASTREPSSKQAAAVPSPDPIRNAAEAPRTTMAITPAPKGDPVYVVQVFSSPARDDAEEWLQVLRSRNIRDAFISEQRIKGDTWYRVRFGQFAKRQDAENAALKIGVNQPWIARVK